MQLPTSEDEWKKTLSEAQYAVLREGKTEPPGSGALLHDTRKGNYLCAGCGQPLFSSEAKYESGTGWPSFWQPLSDRFVEEQGDRSAGMERTEVQCAYCQSHLGHIFDDGPAPTGLRFCVNSLALQFTEESVVRENEYCDVITEGAFEALVERIRQLSAENIDQLWADCGFYIQRREAHQQALREKDIGAIYEDGAVAREKVAALFAETPLSHLQQALHDREKKRV